MNPIEIMWSEVKITLQETWPVFHRKGDELSRGMKLLRLSVTFDH